MNLFDIDKLFEDGESYMHQPLISTLDKLKQHYMYFKYLDRMQKCNLTLIQKTKLSRYVFLLDDPIIIKNVLTIHTPNFESIVPLNYIDMFKHVANQNNYEIMTLFTTLPNFNFNLMDFYKCGKNNYNSIIALLDYKIDSITNYDVLQLFSSLGLKSNFELNKYIYTKFRHIQVRVHTLRDPIIFDQNEDITNLLLLRIKDVESIKYILSQNSNKIVFRDFEYLFIPLHLSEQFHTNSHSIEVLLFIAIQTNNYDLIDYLLTIINMNDFADIICKLPMTDLMLYYLLTHNLTFTNNKNKVKQLYLKEIYTYLYRWYLKLDYSSFDKHLLKIIIKYI